MIKIKQFFRKICLFLPVMTIILTTGCAGAEKSIVLTFTGDCTLGSEERVRGREDSFDSFANRKGYDYFFANFRELFEADDQTIINFEGVLSDDKSQESVSKTYRFRGPTAFTGILTGASIEACSLSNNHIADFGKQGEDNTKQALTKSGIAWFQGFTVYVMNQNGIRIGFMALDNRTYNSGAEKLRKLITDMKAAGEADAFVVCWHTGQEYRGAHEEGTERNAKRVIDAGADLIIINHPHVLQGIGIYHNRYIFYSLGNFVFGGNSAIRTENYRQGWSVSSLYTTVVQVKMVFSDDGRYLGQQPVLYPACTSSAAPVNNYQPYRANAEEAITIRELLQNDTTFSIPEIKADDDGLSRIELDYLAALDNVRIPGSNPDGPQGEPEASDPAPTRNTKGE